MLDLVKQIKEYTEAGIILNHMHLFDRLEEYFAPVGHNSNKFTNDEIESFNECEPIDFNMIPKISRETVPLGDIMQKGDQYTIQGFTDENGELEVFTFNGWDKSECKPISYLKIGNETTNHKEESCTNCIYWMEDIELCSNSVVTNLYSDVEVKDNWCELWRSEDEVINEKDYDDS